MNRSSSSPRRRHSPPAKLGRALESEARLEEFREHIRFIAATKSELWPYLPPSLRSHCELANFRDATLFFVADSPLWAARLRHASPQILHAARQRCKITVARVRVRVAAPTRRAGPAPRRRQLSAAAREHLLQAAQTIGDEELARQLKELAERD